MGKEYSGMFLGLSRLMVERRCADSVEGRGCVDLGPEKIEKGYHGQAKIDAVARLLS